MITIDELFSELQKLTAQVELLRDAQRAGTRDTNLDEIALKAARYPISGHPMSGEDEHIQDMYMLVLMSVIVLEPNKYTESFMTFYRIASGIGYKGDVGRLMVLAHSMKFDTIDEITRLFSDDDKRLLLILECMLIASQFESCKRDAIEYISRLTMLLGISSSQVTFLTNLARVILSQDITDYKTDIKNNYGDLFDCYLNDLIDDKKYVKYINVKFIIVKDGNIGYLKQYKTIGGKTLKLIYHFPRNPNLDKTISKSISRNDNEALFLYRSLPNYTGSFFSRKKSEITITLGFICHNLFYEKVKNDLQKLPKEIN